MTGMARRRFTHPATVRTAGARTLLRPAHRVARGRLLALGLLLGTGRGGGGGGLSLPAGHLEDMLMRGVSRRVAAWPPKYGGGGLITLLSLEFVQFVITVHRS